MRLSQNECKEIIKHLYSKLRNLQKSAFHVVLEQNNSRKYVLHWSRRLGKTHFLSTLSSCVAYSKQNVGVRYASVSQKAVRKMVHPIFKDIFKDLKSEYRPKWSTIEGAYIFPNDSMVHVAGCNNGHSDDLRGTSADLAVVDEAGFIDELKYLVDSVLIPQLITTDGRLIMSSSSPVSPAHEFVDFIHSAKLLNVYSNFTIYDGDYSKDLIAEFCKEAGGEHSTTWRREYLNEIIVDSDYSIIPEATEFLRIGIQNSEYKHYYHKYVAMDIGTRDLTVVLFAYYDFKRAILCIEDEFIITGPQMTTPKIAANVKEYETRLWPSEEPYKRVSDNNNLLLLQDLGYLHNCHFIPTGKDTLEAMVNELRIWIKDGRIEIDPQCTILIESLKYGYWNESRSDWGRSTTLGHFDAIAALMYLVRNIDQHTNPIPVKVTFNQIYDPTHDNSSHEVLAGLVKY